MVKFEPVLPRRNERELVSCWPARGLLDASSLVTRFSPDLAINLRIAISSPNKDSVAPGDPHCVKTNCVLLSWWVAVAEYNI